MFCPKCAAQNVDGSSYCRTCGANISLVPQALTGHPGTANQEDDGYYGRLRCIPSRENAIRGLTVGVAFVGMLSLISRFFTSSGLVAGGAYWKLWMLLPAIVLFSWGVAGIGRLNRSRRTPPAQLNSGRSFDPPANKTRDLMAAVPSVTESTTRHLAGAARTRQLDSPDQRRS